MANKRNMKGLISDIIDKNKSIYRYDDLESITEDEVDFIINSVVNDNDPFGYGCTNKEKVTKNIQIVINHYIDGLTYAQIGKNMGLSSSHISSMGNSGLRFLALRIIRHRNQKELVKPITVEETFEGTGIMINEESDSKHYISEEEYQAFEEEIRKLIKMHLPRVSELDIKRTLIPALEQLNVCVDKPKPIVHGLAYME